jgi:mono/diheme cytochrome c family protein
MAAFSPRLRALGLIATVSVVAFVVLQFIGPRVTNPPVVADLQAPDDVKAVFKTSCYNCHSNETQLWWFDKIAPASWLVARDVKRGRMHLNFSTFGQLSPAQQKAMLYESVNQMQLGAMPPANYLLLHSDAKVVPAQLDTLKKYLHPSDAITPATAEAGAATDAQRQKWIDRGAFPATNVPPAPNGLAFFPDYADWKPVSTTDRFDNGTLRVILGNDVAQRAIALGQVHPWPDGAAFAKIAYKQQPDASGNIWTGEFLQVEFMLKDAEKYKSTEGWGFGRWKTDEHKPYGKNANFTTECASCHRPMESNDFVYTMPLRDPGTPSDAFNATAALPASLPQDPLQWRVITSSVDRTHGTMSTLYGNDLAVDHARKSPQTPYPPNSS